MIRYGIILLIICFCASFVLSMTYKFTYPRIEAQQILEEKESLDEVFSQASDFEEKTMGDSLYYLAKKDGAQIGYVIRAKAKGYGGDINMLVGFDLDGKIQGIKILTHSETPGLGAKINEIRYGEKQPWFLKQFEGKSTRDLDMEDIQAITAATISSEAVLEGVKKNIEEFLDKVKP